MSNGTDSQDILDATLSEDGEVRLKTGDAVRGIGYDQDIPFVGLDGFISVPNAPGDGEAARAIIMSDGDDAVAVGAHDRRFASKVGSAQKGDRFIVSGGEARFLLKRESDSITIYTTNQQEGDKAMSLTLNGSTGAAILTNAGTYIEVKKGEITANVGGAALRLHQGGLDFKGDTVQLDARKVFMGVAQSIAMETLVKAEKLITAVDGMLTAAVGAALTIVPPGGDGGTAGFTAMQSAWNNTKTAIKALKSETE